MGRLDELETLLNSVSAHVDTAVEAQAAQATSITGIATDVATLKAEIAAINSRPTWGEADDASLARMTAVIGPLATKLEALKTAAQTQAQTLAALDAETPEIPQP